MDPLGNIPLFLSVLKTVENESRRRNILIIVLYTIKNKQLTALYNKKVVVLVTLI